MNVENPAEAQRDAIVNVLLADVQDLQERVARLELAAELREITEGEKPDA